MSCARVIYWIEKAGSVDVLHCYYTHGEDNENFQRRSYWMLEEDLSHIVLVHYPEVKQVEEGVEEEPDRYDIFKMTHIKKGSKGEYVDAASTQAVIGYEFALEEGKRKNIEITPQVREDIYAEVLGVEKRNVVRGLGPVVTWRDVPYIHTEKMTRTMQGFQARLEEQRLALEREKAEAARREERVRAEVMQKEKDMREEMERHRREQRAEMDDMV